MREPFPKRVGILGGGQLARMLALDCYKLGLLPIVFSGSHSDSAAQVVGRWMHNDGTHKSLSEFLSEVELVVIENEFTDLKKIKQISLLKPIYPSANALELVQDKKNQKTHMKDNGIPTSPFLEVHSKVELTQAFELLGKKIVLKRARMGYDGRGVHLLNSKAEGDSFFSENPDFNGYAEKYVPFKKELAVLVVKDLKGRVEVFPAVETYQERGMCSWVIRPELGHSIENKAKNIAKQIMDSFGGVGIYAVEMFLTNKNEILVNEIAPRVHNSGHITLDACNVSQFEQHLRAVVGMPLIKPRWTSPGASMVNVIGKNKDMGVINTDYSSQYFSSRLYWYGKSGTVFNRKLGHINSLGKTSTLALTQGLKMRGEIAI